MLHPFISVPVASTHATPVLALSSAVHVGLVYLAIASQTTVHVARAPVVMQQIRYAALAVRRVPRSVARTVRGPWAARSATPAVEEAGKLPALDLELDLSLPAAVLPTYEPDLSDASLTGAGVDLEDVLRLGVGRADVPRGHGARYGAFDPSAVERIVTPDPGNPRPRYPRTMIRGPGDVTFSVFFVVDTAGRVERETVELPLTIHEEFARAVTDVLLRWRFAPAEMGGRPVRQLVQQPFVFRVE